MKHPFLFLVLIFSLSLALPVWAENVKDAENVRDPEAFINRLIKSSGLDF